MKYFYLIFLLCCSGVVRAQLCDTTFIAPDSVQLVVDNPIAAYARNGDTMFIAGDFHSIGRPTGSFAGVDKLTGAPLRQAIWPKIGGRVSFAIKDGQGGWIIGGLFNRVGDSLRKNLVWIDSAAMVRAWNPDVTGAVNCGVLHDSTLYIGGDFTDVHNITRTRIAAVKLDNDATLQSLDVVVNGNIAAMALHGNNLWIGGSFDQVAGQIRNKLTAIDLNTDLPISQVSNLDSTFVAYVATMIIADGNLYVGGVFRNIQTQINGAYIPRLYALSLDAANGALRPWLCDMSTDFNTVTGVYALDTIGSNLVLAGSFDKINNISRAGIGVVSCDSGVVQPFSGAVLENGVTAAAALAHDDTLIYVGNVQYAKSAGSGPNEVVKTYGVAAFNRNTGAVSSFRPVIGPVKNPGTSSVSPYGNYDVYVLINDGDNLFIGGNCKFIGGVIRNRLASFIMSSGQLTSFTSNLFGDDDEYFFHRDSMRFINNMVFSQGRLFLSGRKTSLQPVSIALAACDAQSGDALTFPDSTSLSQISSCLKLVAYGNYVYAYISYFGSRVRRFDPGTLQFDNTWSIEYPFGGDIFSKTFDIYNDILYLKLTDQYNYYFRPYELNSTTELPVTPIFSSRISVQFNDLVDIGFIGDKVILSGRFDRLQNPFPGQDIRYGIGFVNIGGNNVYSPSSHVLDDFNGNIQSSPLYNGIETLGDRIYSTRYDFENNTNGLLLNPRIYDTAGTRWYPQWNPELSSFAIQLVPLYRDTVALFSTGDDMILKDRPYYGMLRFHLGQNIPAAGIQITVLPGQQVTTGTAVNFNATVTNGGSNPEISWFLNNQPIPGANSATWQGIAGIDFADSDVIGARLIGLYPCAPSDTTWSNVLTMSVLPLSINGNEPPASFVLYPNPSDGKINMSGLDKDDKLDLYNSIGAKMESVRMKTGNRNTIDISGYPSGNYLFKFTTKSGATWSRLITKL